MSALRSSAVAGLLLLAGCRDECSAKVDPGHCQANTAVNCPEPGPDQLVPVRWSQQPCATKVCVESSATAFCALDASVSPFCDGGITETCDGVTRVRCNLGFEVGRDPCLACDPDGGACAGGPSTRCTTDRDCAPALACRDAGAASLCTSR